MKVENISDGKIIGIGDITILPGETKEIPNAYERSPVLGIYKELKVANIIGDPSAPEKTQEELAAEKAAAEKKAAEDAAKAKAQALAVVSAMKPAELTLQDQAELFRLSSQYGVNPAGCKDQADIIKKLKAVLKKA